MWRTWRATEAAPTLEITVAAVNSTLQRARATVERLAPSQDASPAQLSEDDPEVRKQLERYVAAFEAYDVDGIVSMFTEDAVWEMPPFTGWYQGNVEIGKLIHVNCPARGPGDMRLLPTSGANRQPAYGLYMREDGVLRAFQIQQLTLGDGGVERVTCYFDLSLFDTFGLPRELV
jgi:RNA polymerase sigma-70 factor (ECF subfamily)